MIPENKKLFQFKELAANGIKQLKPLTQKENPDVKIDETGKTEIIPADIKKIMETVYGDTDNSAQNASERRAPANTDNKTGKYDDNAEWDRNTNIKDFIIETLKNAGYDAENNPNVVNQLFEILIKALVEGKIGIQTDISSVTELISINLNSGSTLERTMLINELIQVILGYGGNTSKSTNGEIKKLILKELSKIVDNQPTPAESEHVELTPVEQAMLDLENAIDNASVNGDMSIKDFLLQFKTKASKYIQLQNPTYSEGFSDIIAMFIASAVNDTSGVKSGLMKDANLSAIKEKFLAFIQDMSFLDTSEGVTGYSSGGEFNIYYLFNSQHRTENGYRVGYNKEHGSHMPDSSFGYNPDGTPNNAIFLKFLVEYLKNDVYGGRLNATQMELVMKSVLINNFGKGYTQSKIFLFDDDGNPILDENGKQKYVNYGFPVLLIDANKEALDKNGNCSLFDELLEAMMKVANNTIKPLNTDDLTDANTTTFINNLFGAKTSLSAAQIYSSENTYLLSNDLGVRGIIQALFDISEQYNIHNAEDYKEFLNVFIKMIYEKCGEEVQVNSSGNPILTKDILQKYFAQGNTLQNLKELVESKELRNAYYMEYILEDGGIDDILDEYGFYQKVDGECWLVACLHALNASETGKQIIANAITDNGDNSWTVRLYDTTKKPAEPVYYTITLDELMEAFGTGWYGGGDPTLMLFELATSRLRKDIDEWFVWQGWQGDMYLWGGFQAEMLRYLTGSAQNTEIYVQQLSNKPGYAQEQADKIKNWVLEQLANGSIESGGVGNYMLTISYGGHAYAVTGVTDKGIYYVDPFHPDKQKFITWAELAERKVKDSNNKPYTVSYISFGYAPLPNNDQ